MPSQMLRVEAFDDVKTRVAKMKANCGRLLERRPPGYKAQIRETDGRITQAMQQAAANPLYADDLLTARVTAGVRWVVPADAVKAMFEMPVNTEEFEDAVVRNGGPLVELLPPQMRSWAYAVEMPCLDDEAFVVGAVCTHALANRLCALLHAEYAHEVRTGQLAVARESYGYHFPDLLTVQDAEAYLKRRVVARVA